jgi:putative ABC transport system permease protein
MKYFHLVWRNLLRKKLRTVLTLLCVFVAFLLFGILCIIKEAFSAGVSMAGADRLMVRHKVSLIQLMPVSYKERMEQIPGVSAVTHCTWFGGIYKDDPKNMIGTFPVDAESYFNMFSDMMVVSPEVMKAWKEKRNGAIVGRATMERFAKSDGWKIGSVIPFTSPIWGPPKGQNQWEFEIVGTYDLKAQKGDNTGFFFHYDYFDEGREKLKGQVGWYSVRVQEPDQAPAIAAKIDEQFANSAYETKAETEAAAMQGFVAQMGDIGTILMSVLAAVFFTIVLVAGNTMSVAVRERTQEFGALKALGFTHQHVLLMVIAESCLIALLGGVLGLGFALIITLFGSPVPQMLPVFILPHRDILLGFFACLALGILAGALPAFEARRLRIADALRRGG